MSKYGMICVTLALIFVAACGGGPASVSDAAGLDESANAQAAIPAASTPGAPAANSTGGFDYARAYEHVRRLVGIGPRPPGSEGIHAAQAYIIEQLKSYGCQVEEHDFRAPTPIGDVMMKNIIAKVPGFASGIVLYATHYDTVNMANFVGADDGGSGTGTMLELARVMCGRKNALNVWIAFFDGEEAQGHWADAAGVQWTAANSTFGSRELAAGMAMSGDLKRLKAMILADMIGPSDLKIKRDTNSTRWLTDLIWATAARMGYGNVFVNESTTVSGDDHLSFTRRGISACDIIDFDVQTTYWHTPQDTLEKVDPRSLGIAGNVFVGVLPELEKKFRGAN
jgi:glutaminyl-peptide cyclotransferase